MIAIDREQRMRASEASQKIVEPFRKVVEIAMRRVREGLIDDLGRQRVVLLDEAAKRIYQVTDVSVRVNKFGRVTSKGWLEGGLFIDGVQLDEEGEGVSSLVSIQIPREVSLVDKRSLYGLRGSDPEDVKRLAKELDATLLVGSTSRFDDALQSEIERKRKAGRDQTS